MGAPGEPKWAVIVPLKPLDRGKSRLDDDTERRARLALAFVRDAVASALACPLVIEVVVVTDDPRATAVLRSEGARVISDPPGGGLNAAFEHGASTARQRDAAIGVAALAGDLPALRPEELTTALRAAWDRRRCYVPDADGTGTALLTARPGVGLGALFGIASADEHLASGAYPLELTDVPGLRRDVDTADDLAVAVALGVGPATEAAIADLAT